jgi:hypothetical protein
VEVSRLMEIVVRRLRFGPLELPQPGESEPAYTRRCLQPAVAAEIEALGIEGLWRGGDGAAPVPTIAFLGRRFFADLTVHYHSQPILACEVKLLRAPSTQNALATAIGQASLYREAGYPRAALVLVDMVRQLPEEAVRAADRGFAALGLLHLVVRRPGSQRLNEHPALGTG